MILFSTPVETESDTEWNKLWDEESVDGRLNTTFQQFVFRAHLRLAEKDMEKRGQLVLFRKTKELPAFPRVENAIKRGWAKWVREEIGIRPSQPGDHLTLHQFLFLYGFRRDQSREEKEERIRRYSKLIADSKARGDSRFLCRLRHIRADTPRKQKDYRIFIQSLLANWLTAFWWLMPLHAVASDIARIEGKSDEKTFDRIYQNLRQITTRASGGWKGVFVSGPALIEYMDGDLPKYSAAGIRLLA